MKKEHPTLSGPDMHQLCQELHELENDLFSYNSNVNHGAKMILKHEVTQEIWDEFVAKIEWCKGIKYETFLPLKSSYRFCDGAFLIS